MYNFWRRNAADSRLRLLEQAAKKDPADFELRLQLMREQLRNNLPVFRYSITYQEVYPSEEDEEPETDSGFDVQDIHATFEDLMTEARMKYVEARHPNDLTSWWDTQCDEDMYTGVHRCEAFHVEYSDGQSLHSQMFDIINAAIKNGYKVPVEFKEDED